MNQTSTLEVVHHGGLEVVHHDEGLHAAYPEYIGYGELHPKVYPTDAGPPKKKKICGLSRPIFWLAVAMAVLAVIVIGVGVGLGVVLSNNTKAQSADTAPPPSPPQLTATVTLSETSTSPSSTLSTTTSTSTPPTPTETNNMQQLFDALCPSKHDSIIKASVGGVQYRVLCDSDFGPGGGKETLGSFDATTWESCVDLCNTMNYFQDRSDVGCTWNAAGTGGQTPGKCWCFGGPNKVAVENKGSVVAVPQ